MTSGAWYTEAMDKVREKYRKLTLLLIEKNITVSTMESCTAGQIASLLTDTEGSSAVFRGAYVSYSNDAKRLLGVHGDTIEKYGVYSVQTSAAMAAACREFFRTDIGIGITGSFGNVDPNNADSVPGEVFFSIATADKTSSFRVSIPALESRLDYKLYISDIIADRLLEVIS